MRIVVQWWERHYNLATLYRWLVDNDQLSAEDYMEVERFLSKPWHWNPEWEECKADMAQRGTPVERDGTP